MSQILIARSIAEEAHLGQFRRDGKTPYIEHPRQVSHRLYHLDDNYIAAAWLHDVIEDNSNFTLNSLRDRGVNEKIISAVDCSSSWFSIIPFYLSFIYYQMWLAV